MYDTVGRRLSIPYNVDSNAMKYIHIYIHIHTYIYEREEFTSSWRDGDALFLFSYLLFVFFCGPPSLLLSLTARINPATVP